MVSAAQRSTQSFRDEKDVERWDLYLVCFLLPSFISLLILCNVEGCLYFTAWLH